MGCDCGCGGTCPMCASRLAREMSDRAFIINQTAEHLGEETKKRKKKPKKVKK